MPSVTSKSPVKIVQQLTVTKTLNDYDLVFYVPFNNI